MVFEKYEIRKAFLFGSIQRNSCLPDADIDIYVEELKNEKYWEMLHDLEELANQPIDLYCQLDDPVFIAKVKNRGELVYESRS